MTMRNDVKLREYDKFRPAATDLTKVAVTIEQDPANPIPINVNESPDLPDGYESVSIFSAAAAVATSVETVVNSIIVSSEFLLIDSIEVSGTNRARFNLYLNNSLVATKRTNNLNLETEFKFSTYKLVQTDKLEVKVYHERPDAGDFEARIIGVSKL